MTAWGFGPGRSRRRGDIAAPPPQIKERASAGIAPGHECSAGDSAVITAAFQGLRYGRDLLLTAN